jgi:DNA-binding Xre family transcriptional regulator
MTAKAKKNTRKPAAKRPPKRASVGSSFDSFLHEEGTFDETQAIAIKRVIAWALAQEMRKKKITKTAMAERMATSRSQLDRLLDPENADVKLETLSRAARAVDCELRVELVAA